MRSRPARQEVLRARWQRSAAARTGRDRGRDGMNADLSAILSQCERCAFRTHFDLMEFKR